MPNYLQQDIVKSNTRGFVFFSSGSTIYLPSSSNAATAAVLQIKVSSSLPSNIISNTDINPFIKFTTVSGSNTSNGLDNKTVIRFFTASHVQEKYRSSSGTTSIGYMPPTSKSLYHTGSTSVENLNFIDINYSRETTGGVLGNQIYEAIFNSSLQTTGLISASFESSSNLHTTTITYTQRRGEIGTPSEVFTGSGAIPLGESISTQYTDTGSGALNFIPQQTLIQESASYVVSPDINDNSSFEIKQGISSSAFITNSQPTETILYFSGSGKVGLNTNDPQSDFDILVNEAQFQKPGTRKGLKINQDGNIESFDKDPATSSTGSEFLLRFSRGTAITKASTEAIGLGPFADDAAAQAFFNGLKAPEQNSILEKIERIGFIDPPQVGDTLGSIRWVAESGSTSGYNDRSTGETAVIKAVVSDGAADGIAADLIFSVAGKTGAAQQKFLLDATNTHQLTGSLNINGGLTATSTATFTQNVNFNGNIVGDGFTNIENISSISGFGNVSMGNNGNEVHQLIGDTFIKRVSGDGGDLLFQTSGVTKLKINHDGNITASGDISASGYIYGRQLEQNDMSVSTITPTDSYIYFPLGGQTRDENATVTNQNIQKLAVVPGKPRKAIIRAVTPGNGLGNTSFTCSYHAANPGTSSVSLIAAKYSISTGTNHEAVTFDFTNGVDEGSWDDVPAGARVYMSIKVPNTAFLSEIDVLGATSLWEWDYGA